LEVKDYFVNSALRYGPDETPFFKDGLGNNVFVTNGGTGFSDVLSDLLASSNKIVINTSRAILNKTKTKQKLSVIPSERPVMGDSMYAVGELDGTLGYMPIGQLTALSSFPHDADYNPNFDQPFSAELVSLCSGISDQITTVINSLNPLNDIASNTGDVVNLIKTTNDGINGLASQLTDTNTLLTQLLDVIPQSIAEANNYLLEAINGVGAPPTDTGLRGELHSYLNTPVPMKIYSGSQQTVVSKPISLAQLMLRGLFQTGPLSESSGLVHLFTAPYLGSTSMVYFVKKPGSNEFYRQKFENDYPVPLAGDTVSTLLSSDPVGSSSWDSLIGDFTMDPFARMALYPGQVTEGGLLPTQIYTHPNIPLAANLDHEVEKLARSLR